MPASSNVQSIIVKVEQSSLTLICTLLEFLRISPWKYHVTSGLGYPAKPASNLALWPSFSLTSLISLINFGACSVSRKKTQFYFFMISYRIIILFTCKFLLQFLHLYKPIWLSILITVEEVT